MNKKVKAFKKVLIDFIIRIPIISDYYHYYWRFPKAITACRGVFHSFSEAWEAIPKNFPKGYSQPKITQSDSVSVLTAASKIGTFDQRDYPLVLWLSSCLVEGSKVFDLGGNVGLQFYAYQKYVRYPENLTWTVCEIPEIVEAGERIALERNCSTLKFTTDFSKAENSNIFLTRGTLQYLEGQLAEMLRPFTKKPQHLLIHAVPFYEGDSFFTLQNIGYSFCPYQIQNRTEFIDSIQTLGYELIDSWIDGRTGSIPFHPERFVKGYYGFYFRDKD